MLILYFFSADRSSELANVRSFFKDFRRVTATGSYLDSPESWKEVYEFMRDLPAEAVSQLIGESPDWRAVSLSELYRE